MKKITLFLILGLFISSTAVAENSMTLPHARFRARLKPIYAFEFGSKFDETGNAVNLVKELEVSIDKEHAEKLNPLLAGAMAAYGVDNLGSFAPSLKISSLVLGIALEFGLTDKLTLGLIAPVVSANSTYQLRFDMSDSAKPFFGTQDFVKGAEELAVQRGYQRPGNWEAFGLGDLEMGLKYSFLRSDLFSLAAKGGIRLPTGRTDDPDNLTDLAFGDGQTDLGTTVLADYIGLPNTLVNGLLKYTVQLPDKQPLRMPQEGELFALNNENIKRNLGDVLDAAIYTQYTFLTLFNLNASYAYYLKRKDNYESSNGLSTKRLEQHSDQRRHTADVGLGFSTLPWVRQGTFALPMELGVNLQLPVAGKNVAKTTMVNLEYMVYF